MSKTLRYISTTGKDVTFANIAKPSETLSVSNERVRRTRNNTSADIVRTKFIKSELISLKAPGYDDQCAPSGEFTRLIRIETSHPSGDAAVLIQDLKDLVAYIEANPTTVEGFNPPQSTDIILGSV